MIEPVLLLLLACFCTASIALFLKGRGSFAFGWVATSFLALFFGKLVASIMENRGGPFVASFIQEPLSGLALSFYIDGLSLAFLGLISGIGVLVLIYGSGYFRGKGGDWIRCLGFLQLFIAGMVGLVTAGNLLLLFVFWELTTLSSYFLIGFYHEKEEARASALMSLLITGFGGLCLLAGVILIGAIGGSLELTELFGRAELFAENSLTPFAIVLVLIGCFAKSAQFPFHAWLPAAMAAPTPVSAYLHSATMVKAGVFLAARLAPLFSGVLLWHGLLLIVGSITALWGILMAMRSHDLKRILAYTTVSGLGILFALLGVGTEQAVEAALVFLLVHALYKAGLFMVAGGVDVITGYRDIRKLGGLFGLFPVLGFATLVLCLSMAGFPPLLGFIAKELIYEANFAMGTEALLLGIMSVLAMIFTVAVAYFFFTNLFYRAAPGELKTKSVSFLMILPPLVLAVLSVCLGLFPQPVADYILEPGILAIMSTEAEIKLSLWHGFNWILLASLVTLGVGAFFGAKRLWWSHLLEKTDQLKALSPTRLIHLLVKLFNLISVWQTKTFFGGGYTRGAKYLVAGLCFTLLLVIYNVVRSPLGSWGGMGSELDIFGVLAIVLIIVPAILVPYFRSRLSAVLIAGVTGVGIGLLFATHGAPDIAITQILVETFVLLFFVFVVRRLPLVEQWLPNSKNRQAVVLALVASMGLSGMVYWSLQHQGPRPVTDYFIANTEPMGFGHNVVNVILVDFRAFDTLGEITVLALATLGIVSLIKEARRRKNEISNS